MPSPFSRTLRSLDADGHRRWAAGLIPALLLRIVSPSLSPPRRFLVPEVVQTSAMDCGPAALKALFEGFGIPISYGRLREACQTDLDGTSIDTMEDVANRLGLEAEQVMVPLDHLLVAEARCLPAIVVVVHPNGLTHFVVAWRRHGGLVQVMDPATGRRWPSTREFLDHVYLHRMPVPAAGWRGWAGSEEFQAVLRARLGGLGLAGDEAEALLGEALADPGWRSLADAKPDGCCGRFSRAAGRTRRRKSRWCPRPGGRCGRRVLVSIGRIGRIRPICQIIRRIGQIRPIGPSPPPRSRSCSAAPCWCASGAARPLKNRFTRSLP